MNQGGYGDGMGGGGGGGNYYNNYGGQGDTNEQQYNSYSDGNYNDESNPYQQQQYYEEGANNQQSQDAYYDENGGYYDVGDQQQQQQYQDPQQNYGEYPATETYEGVNDNNGMAADTNSLFYPTQTPFVTHPNGQPDNYGNYDTVGDPISAIAVDEGGETSTGNVPALLYVASHTSKQGERGNARTSVGRQHVGKNADRDLPLSRGSRMTVLYNDDNANDNDQTAVGGGFYGNRSMYSSFVAHPEAPGRVLDGLHSIMFGGGNPILGGTSSTASSSYANTKARPSHAYGPPFGPPCCNHNRLHTSNVHRHHFNPHQNNLNNNRPEDKHCMGITSIFPVYNSQSRVCTVSPYGVRIHTRGGMIMSQSKSDGVLSGMTCGELLGGQFATVGGMSFPSSNYSGVGGGSSRRHQHVHCVDLQRDLKIVSSHTLIRNPGTSSGGEGLMCVTDMSTNYERNNVVVGCSDGTIRVLDGGKRNAEVAKAKAQIGGVAKVVVSENLICATGYTATGHSTPSSPLPYPFPAPHVLIYDVRYLGRGGIPHMFSANRGGPKFINFLEGVGGGSNNILVGSGQTFGSFEVITPFDNNVSGGGGAGNTFFQPELNAGEAMSTVDVHNGELYIGTSHGRVLQYGMPGYEKTVHSTKNSMAHPRSLSGGLLGGSSVKRDVSSDSFGGGMTGSSPLVKEPLDMPPFVPSPPELCIDPTILLNSSSLKSSEQPIQGWNVFGSYTMASNPIVSSDKALFHPRYSRSKVGSVTLGPLSLKAMVPPSKRWLSHQLLGKLEESKTSASDRGSVGSSAGAGGADFVKVFPTSSLELNDLLSPADDSTFGKEKPVSSNYRGKKPIRAKTNMTFPNPNKFLYSGKIFAACYDATADPRKKMQDGNTGRQEQQMLGGEEDWIESEESGIPRRYRLTLHPPFYKLSAKNFDYSTYNDTNFCVGWDYAPTFSNRFTCSILAMLYFVGEIRDMALGLQLKGGDMSLLQGGVGGKSGVRMETSVSITAELGLLFHLIESLSANGMIQPDNNNQSNNRGQVKAFVPSNFIAAFAMLPEATNLALIDGVAGSAEIARRPEAFYRFLMQYMERELGQLLSRSTPTVIDEQQQQAPSGGHLIDRMQGIGFISVIEYARGKPKISASRALTVDLAYDQKLTSTRTSNTTAPVRFGEILCFSLCKEAPLRAWCDETRSYEAVVQRKIATSLPSLLSLSCCCAGRKTDSHGLQFWQQEDTRNWLPESIEIQIGARSITVKELVVKDDGKEEWMTFEKKLPMSGSFSEEWEKELTHDELPIKKSYRLDAAVSFIRTTLEDDASLHSSEGHHVVHVRNPVDLERNMLTRQLQRIDKCLAENEQKLETDEDESSDTVASNDKLTLVSDISLQERKNQVQQELAKLKVQETRSDQWLLLNGFVVTKVDNSDDVRSFNAKFKEPSIVLFREIDTCSDDGDKDAVRVEPSKALSEVISDAVQQETAVPMNVMETTSISNGHGSKLTISDSLNLPGSGELVAIDAEFVCVQSEESLITSSGSKEIISEPRNALARLSMINCQTNEVIIDDYILPQEPVVDYLTRFSGILQNDLDVNSSPHHLVTPQEAYLKVRLLMERGCIFVGHGLSQDFRVINICIPPNQIIDTAEIFHQRNQRHISLRYLTNYVLGRDMQQEVHDSIEDAKAAHELYIKALSLKKEAKFDDYLMQLYAHGHKTQFKLLEKFDN